MIKDTSTPIVILNCRLAALAIMRSLGPYGVKIYGVDSDPGAPAIRSRYCSGSFVSEFNENAQGDYLALLKDISKKLGGRPVLIPTSDETSEFVADFGEELSRFYRFPRNSPKIVRGLANKKEMFFLAGEHGVPVPQTKFPRSLADVHEYMEKSTFPVMLKGIYGNRLQLRSGLKMYIAKDPDELLRMYELMEDPEFLNLMLQEYIPGGDDQVYIFNGYFNGESDSIASFTGKKIRQFPVHTGCASLGIMEWNSVVAENTVRFMKEIGYRGILDIGYRYDERDGRYKVLDINPRIGQAFRLFLDEEGMDVARALYLDLTGQECPAVVPREGRRWLIEDFDIISSIHYYKEGTLGLFEWLRSFYGVEETAWFNLKDPAPFGLMLSGLLKRTLGWTLKKSGIGPSGDIRSRKA